MLAHKLLSAHLSVEIFLLKIYTYVIYEELYDTGRYANFSHQGLRGGALQRPGQASFDPVKQILFKKNSAVLRDTFPFLHLRLFLFC
jgi:hypothetical protein